MADKLKLVEHDDDVDDMFVPIVRVDEIESVRVRTDIDMNNGQTRAE